MESWWIRFNYLLALAGGALLGLMMLVSVIDICARYFFDQPIVGVVEALTLALPVAVFLPLAYVEIRGAHIRVDLLTGRFPEKVRILLDLVSSLLGITLFAIITWFGWNYAVESWQNNEVGAGMLGLVVYPTKTAIAIGFTLAGIQLIVMAVRSFLNLFRKSPYRHS